MLPSSTTPGRLTELFLAAPLTGEEFRNDPWFAQAAIQSPRLARHLSQRTLPQFGQPL
jgi:hypothetical protein